MTVYATPPDELHRPPSASVERSGIVSLGRGRTIVLGAALAFLVGCLAFVVGTRQGSGDPLSATDAGFMRDMSYHHDQAVQMSTILLGKAGVDVSLRNYADEILKEQRFEQGFMNATLDRFGYPSNPGTTSMAWMGMAVPLDSMDGLATEAQMTKLSEAEGADAEALWVALMSEHHLGGLHMADWEARHGRDETVTNLAQAMVRTQRSEVIDLARFRQRRDLAVPPGFSDPMRDSRLNPPSSTTAPTD